MVVENYFFDFVCKIVWCVEVVWVWQGFDEFELGSDLQCLWVCYVLVLLVIDLDLVGWVCGLFDGNVLVWLLIQK